MAPDRPLHEYRWSQTAQCISWQGQYMRNVWNSPAGASLCFDVRKPLRTLQHWGTLRQRLHEAPFMSLLWGQLNTLTKPSA